MSRIYIWHASKETGPGVRPKTALIMRWPWCRQWVGAIMQQTINCLNWCCPISVLPWILSRRLYALLPTQQCSSVTDASTSLEGTCSCILPAAAKPLWRVSFCTICAKGQVSHHLKWRRRTTWEMMMLRMRSGRGKADAGTVSSGNILPANFRLLYMFLKGSLLMVWCH